MGVFRQRSGSALCYACGKLNRVDAAVCFYCGRRQPGLWGFAPGLGRLLGRVSVAKAITLVCGAAYLLVAGARSQRPHASAGPLQSAVAEFRRAGRARDDRRLCPGPGSMVDAPDRHLPARRLAPRRVQHAAGSISSRPPSRRSTGGRGSSSSSPRRACWALRCRASLGHGSRSGLPARCSACSARWWPTPVAAAAPTAWPCCASTGSGPSCCSCSGS